MSIFVTLATVYLLDGVHVSIDTLLLLFLVCFALIIMNAVLEASD
jgi:hypothetical protein